MQVVMDRVVIESDFSAAGFYRIYAAPPKVNASMLTMEIQIFRNSPDRPGKALKNQNPA